MFEHDRECKLSTAVLCCMRYELPFDGNEPENRTNVVLGLDSSKTGISASAVISACDLLCQQPTGLI